MRSILIVEDENIIAKSIRSVLRRLGYTTAFIAKSAKQALRILKKETVDIVLCDIVIEGEKNGIELAQLIKNTYNIPVVFLSAHSNEEIVDQAKRSQPYGYITKPFKLNELRIALDIALHNFTMERELVQSERKYHLLTEAIMDIIFAIDNLGNITFLNSAFEKITGFSRDAFVGTHYKNLIAPESVEKAMANVNRESLKGDIPLFELDILHKYKGKFTAEIHMTAMYDAKGKRDGFIGTIRDVTQRKRSEEELKKAYEMLENTQHELVQSKTLANLGEFAAGIAHEIRNPLANISALAQYSTKKFDLEKRMVDNLDAIVRSTERANRIIKDLLDFARPHKLNLSYTNVNEVIETVCHRTHANRLNQQVSLYKHCQKNLPKLHIDSMQIEQALMNIVMNALDAMGKGGKLSITSRIIDDHVVITIKDSGRGIPRKAIDKIFNPFFTQKPHGVGLGLSVTHRIIQSHRGKIEVESTYNKGTKLMISFPLEGSKQIGEQYA